jgi:hypothetical protein
VDHFMGFTFLGPTNERVSSLILRVAAQIIALNLHVCTSNALERWNYQERLYMGADGLRREISLERPM